MKKHKVFTASSESGYPIFFIFPEDGKFSCLEDIILLGLEDYEFFVGTKKPITDMTEEEKEEVERICTSVVGQTMLSGQIADEAFLDPIYDVVNLERKEKA